MSDGSSEPDAKSESTTLTDHSLAPQPREMDNAIDDIWHEPSNDRFGTSEVAPQSITTPDIQRLHTMHTTSGYREGLATSRETSVQSGFDEGHLLGAAVGIRAGYLQGLIEGLERGVVLDTVEASVRDTLTGHLRSLKCELQLQKLLGEQFIAQDGTWKWDISSVSDGQAATVGFIANQHPVIVKISRALATYAQALQIQRVEPL